MKFASLLVTALAGWLGQDPQEDFERQLAELIDRSGKSWTVEERAALKTGIAEGVAVVDPSHERTEEVLAALPVLLRWWKPRVKPVFSGQFEEYNDRIPIPDELRRREFAAAMDTIRSTVQSGLTAEPLTADQRSDIEAQIDYLLVETRKQIGAAIRGEKSLEVLDKKLKGVRAFAIDSIGKPYQLGITRVLSKAELREVLTKIRLETERVNGLEVLPMDPLNIPSDDEEGRRLMEVHALLEDVVGVIGHSRVLCHPEAYTHLDTLEAVQNEYFELVQKYAKTMKEDANEDERRIWEDIEAYTKNHMREKKKRNSAQSPTETSENKTPVSGTPNQEQPNKPQAQGLPIWSFVVGAMIVVLVSILLLRIRSSAA